MLCESGQKRVGRGREGQRDTHREVHTGKRQSDKECLLMGLPCVLHICICVHPRGSNLRQESCEHVGRRNYRECEQMPRSQGHYLIIQVLSITFQS